MWIIRVGQIAYIKPWHVVDVQFVVLVTFQVFPILSFKVLLDHQIHILIEHVAFPVEQVAIIVVERALDQLPKALPIECLVL
jgi:hypothetical protein